MLTIKLAAVALDMPAAPCPYAITRGRHWYNDCTNVAPITRVPILPLCPVRLRRVRTHVRTPAESIKRIPHARLINGPHVQRYGYLTSIHRMIRTYVRTFAEFIKRIPHARLINSSRIQGRGGPDPLPYLRHRCLIAIKDLWPR